MPTASAVTSLTLDEQLAPAGAAAASFARLWRSLWSQPYLAPELLELCRLTLARLHRDQAELEAVNPFVPAGQRQHAAPRSRQGMLTRATASRPRKKRCSNSPRVTRSMRSRSATHRPRACGTRSVSPGWYF